LEVEGETNLLKPGGSHGVAQLVTVAGVEQQKSAAPRTDKLAADGAVLHAKIIPLVDLGIAHSAGPALLVLPMLMHQRAKLRRLAGLEKRFTFQSEFLDEMQVVDHLLVAVFGPGVLILE